MEKLNTEELKYLPQFSHRDWNSCRNWRTESKEYFSILIIGLS